mmetsp:Transcript_27127/g.58070  ORF Transcript_27127/g.58070 Transcript_27127/m.58070 type:complete len:98 (+) Transcript_27127:2253-2546(+)
MVGAATAFSVRCSEAAVIIAPADAAALVKNPRRDEAGAVFSEAIDIEKASTEDMAQTAAVTAHATREVIRNIISRYDVVAKKYRKENETFGGGNFVK